MYYDLELTASALRELKQLSPDVSRRIERKLDTLRQDLQGDVKRLRDFMPRYRLRVGDWRVLFEIEGSRIVVHRVIHRSKAYG